MAPSQRIACQQQLWRQCAFTHDPLSVRAAREFTTATLARWGVVERSDDINLCVSELATNSLLHSSDRAVGFLVFISAIGDQVRVEVCDTGAGLPKPADPEETCTAGRGLLLVAAYADDWGFNKSIGGPGMAKSVWAQFKADRPSRHQGSRSGDTPW